MKKCKVCKVEFEPKKPLQMVCGYECALAYAKAKLAERQAKESKKRQSERKESLKKKSDYLKDAKKVFQLWIRKRDFDQPCISCGTKETKLWDGGHYKKAELYFGVIFDERNLAKQCRRCNRFLGGNELNYRQGLIEKHGVEFVEQLEKDANETRNKNWSKEELIEIKKKYLSKLTNL